MPRDAGPELLVVQKAFDLVIWGCRHVARFPRSYRVTLGDRLEHRLYSILEDLLRAKYTRERMNILRGINCELELLRYQFRVASELKCLSHESYGHAARSVNEIGQMVGGWMKSAKA